MADTPLDSAALLERYDKILRIRINHSNAGFFAYLTFAINQLRLCEAHRLFPVVYFGPVSGDGPNAFYEARYGDNTWDYYFEPVAGLTYDQVRRRIEDPRDPLSASDLVELSTQDLWRMHAYDPESIFNYPYGVYRDVDDLDTWYEAQRRKARRYLVDYVRVKPHVQAKVEEFWADRLAGAKVVGVHMRGSDKGSADASPQLSRIIPPEEYFPHIDRFLEQAPDGKIFLATEQAQFVDEMRARYGDTLVTRQVARTTGFGSQSNPFQKLEGSPYLKGEEVLIDCLLLAKTDFLLRCTSAVGEYAIYFNERLECVNLNH